MLSFPLLALAVASFGIGTTEFVIMGLLPDVAGDLGVDVPTAGLLVSGYALSVALGSPLIAIAMARLPRKAALIGLMAIFLAGNLGCALAPSYASLMAARIGTALAHGAFFGIGAVVASSLVTPNKRAQAVAMMFAGLTLANVLGVPLGTALGQWAGWRATFWAVTVIGVAAVLAMAAALPRNIEGARGSLLGEFRALAQWRVLQPMLISTVSSVSLFSVFTYITPLLQDVTGLTPREVTWALLLFGVGLTIGNIVGGRLADWRMMPSLTANFVLLVLTLAAFAYASRFVTPSLVTLSVWGALAFALVSPLQIWVMDAARDAPNLASTLNQSAFNLGNSAGAWIGGVAITHGVRYGELPLLGAIVAALGLGLVVAAVVRGPRGTVAA